jgi:hypothetical protein
LDISQLIRDPVKIHQDLKTLPDNRLLTTKGCRIQIPANWQTQKLAYLGTEIYILGIFAIILEDRYYGVSRAPTMFHIEPDSTQTVKIQDNDYLEFNFEPNTTVAKTVEVLMDNQILYNIYNEFIAKGSVPWYFSYRDLGALFEHSKRYSSTELGANHMIQEMVAATIARNPAKLTEQYRHSLKSYDDLAKTEPTIIKLNSVSYSATNTTAKLIGAYFEEGTISALINPSTQEEPIEAILRR